MCPSSRPRGDYFSTTPQMRITDQSVTIALTGALTGASVPILRLHLLTLAAPHGPGEILLDLSGVHTVDREGAEPLLEAARLQYQRGAVLRLVATSGAMLRFFHGETRFARLLIPPTAAPTDPPTPGVGNEDQPPTTRLVSLSDRRSSSLRSTTPQTADVRAAHRAVASSGDGLDDDVSDLDDVEEVEEVEEVDQIPQEAALTSTYQRPSYGRIGQSTDDAWDIQIGHGTESFAEQLRAQVDQLRTALESRTTTARATGVLAARFDMSTDQAWSLLCDTSHLSNRKVIDVARIIIDMHDNIPIIDDDELRVAVAFASVLDASVARAKTRQADRKPVRLVPDGAPAEIPDVAHLPGW